jgi:glutathione S-transferase
MGRVPALEDADVTIFESGAIVEYVLARYGEERMQPSVNSLYFPMYLQWLHYAEGMIMPPVNVIVVETILLPADRRNDVNVSRATKLLGQMLGAVDAHMKGRDYLAGEFSGADIMTGHACTVAKRLGADTTDKPDLEAYIERCNARPAMQRAWAV